MADRDSFIDEVSEELRRDRMLTAWRRWGPWVVGVVVLAVAAAGVATWLDQQENVAAREAGARLIEAADIPDPAERAEALAAYAAEGEPFRLLALEARAVARLQAGDLPGAREDVEAGLATRQAM